MSPLYPPTQQPQNRKSSPKWRLPNAATSHNLLVSVHKYIQRGALCPSHFRCHPGRSLPQFQVTVPAGVLPSNCILWLYFHFLYHVCISRPLVALNYLPYNLCFCFQLAFTAESCQKSHILNIAVGHTLKPHKFPGFLAARHKLPITLGQTLSSYGTWNKFSELGENAPTRTIHSYYIWKTVTSVLIHWQVGSYFWNYSDDRGYSCKNTSITLHLQQEFCLLDSLYNTQVLRIRQTPTSGRHP